MASISGFVGRMLTTAFAPRPTISREGNLLVIQSGWRTALLTLGGRSRRISIDASSGIVRIRDRRFWVFHSGRVIDFHRVREIIYSYADLMDSGWISHDTMDFFQVGLWLDDGSTTILFRFFGQGEFVNNSIYPDWMHWEDFLEGRSFPHAMESESGALAALLEHAIGVPIGSGPS